MLDALKQFFDRSIAPEAVRDEQHALEVATAALLIEVMRLDGADDVERAAVVRALQGKFGLTPDEAATLVKLADDEARESVGYYQFTSLINRHFDAARKARIVELMWQVAYADDTLSAHEQHVIRKIADLLYLPHGDYIAAKLRARDAPR